MIFHFFVLLFCLLILMRDALCGHYVLTKSNQRLTASSIVSPDIGLRAHPGALGHKPALYPKTLRWTA